MPTCRIIRIYKFSVPSVVSMFIFWLGMSTYLLYVFAPSLLVSAAPRSLDLVSAPVETHPSARIEAWSHKLGDVAGNV